MKNLFLFIFLESMVLNMKRMNTNISIYVYNIYIYKYTCIWGILPRLFIKEYFFSFISLVNL